MRNLLVFILFLFVNPLVFAQSYDGDADVKLFVGYTNVNGLSGGELQIDYGTTDLISFGSSIIYLYDENSLENDEFLNQIDMNLFIRLHGSIVLDLPYEIDPYTSLEFSLRSVAANAGLKYHFSEYVGVFAQYTHSFSKSLAGDDPDFINLFAEPRVTAGVSFYIN